MIESGLARSFLTSKIPILQDNIGMIFVNFLGRQRMLRGRGVL